MNEMNERKRPKNVVTLTALLRHAEADSYAVGSFSPRYTAMIRPVLRAIQQENSPAIVQISQKEFIRYGITAQAFAAEFYSCLKDEGVTVPVALHLDHTVDFPVIRDAIASGFTSVMIDASQWPLAENIRRTQEVVQYAHKHSVSVEAELGKIGNTNNIETDNDEELFTDPAEARQFVEATAVDALAVSVGTIHGVYLVKEPRIDFDRLRAIRSLTPVPLVLHGGSGVPAAMIHEAIALPGGGISKVNIATDLELALLKRIGREEIMTNQECLELPKDVLELGRSAVEDTVREKIGQYVRSRDKNWYHPEKGSREAI